MIHYLFSFSGRINRAKQWAIILVGIAFEVIVVTIFGVVVGVQSFADLANEKITFTQWFTSPQMHTFLLIGCALYLAMLYIALAVSAKRLHDRNKSALWLLVFYVLPLALSIPALMSLGDLLHQLEAAMKAAQAGGTPPVMEQSPLVTLTNGVATIIQLWAFIELFILRGTVGDNKYGPDPLAGKT